MAEDSQSSSSLNLYSKKKKFLIAAGCGLLICVTTFWIGYQVADGVPVPEQAYVRATPSLLRLVRDDIQSFREANGRLPESLRELEESLGPDDDNWVEFGDRWGRPYVYHNLDDGHYELYSLGRDGEPGGIGPDTDFQGLDPDEGKLGFVRFLLSPGMGSLWMAAIGSGIAFAAILLVTPQRNTPSRLPPTIDVMLNIGALLVVAVIIGYVMAFYYAVQHTH